ncbi:hypothetical protein DL240_12155 [Lujinxingia litoralis]|uniref:Cytochrome c domain-containing protein n=1 Tax=Lujinxingia litoralis TaxID=2211119 RepID=A0A328C651_9DELT|nr:cytochrome c [Lujinxingia litoralis]RAL21603.1 hypothetical protein DL240_12155 [Lujinxingia litoralis]
MKNATLKNGLKIALVAGGMVALIPTVYGQGIGLQTLDRMLVPTPQKLERGEKVFAEQCATCHGDQGQGGAELGERNGAQGFVGTEVQRSGLESIYSVVAHGYATETFEHTPFNNLFFQDQWAVSHYVHSLIDNPNPVPAALQERIRQEAEFGVCDPEIRGGIAGLVEPSGDEQLAKGEEIFAAQCASCHGAQGGGDGPAGGALNPPPRNFAAPPADWTNGTSALAIYNTLFSGIAGTSMPAYGHLAEDELWALTHYVRESFVPAENQEPATDTQVDDVCRSLSAPPRPDAIPVNDAMRFLAADAADTRLIRLGQYDAPVLAADADASNGQQIYGQMCASCHGSQGAGARNVGPYGAFPPFLHINVGRLVPAAMGGTYQDVAARTIGGVHATLPDMPPVATLSAQSWKDLQAYVASFEGQGSDRVGTAQPAEVPADDLTPEQGASAPAPEQVPAEETQN